MINNGKARIRFSTSRANAYKKNRYEHDQINIQKTRQRLYDKTTNM